MTSRRERVAKDETQTIGAKKAEAQRKAEGKRLLIPGAGKGLISRANLAQRDLESLCSEVRFDPFLEIGAGTGVRSVALKATYSADGVASDISQNTLLDASIVALLLKTEETPFLLCCDLLHLPFLADTFNFVFAYRTLHHHPNPAPVLTECYRVLGRMGHFFFNEEPMDSPLRRLLRGKRTLSSPPTFAQKIGYSLNLEKVFWDDGRLERSIGITEARFDRLLWLDALRIFERVDVTVNRRLGLRSNLQRPLLTAWLSGLVGGNVRGLGQKLSGERVHEPFRQRLICLDCGTRLSLSEKIVCSGCGRSYPYYHGVLRMLPSNLEKELYTG